jgi:hypothetical protein
MMKMKGNPLNSDIYKPDFDLNSHKIVITDGICVSHNKLWMKMIHKTSQSNKADQKKPLSMGLQQFHTFGNVIHDF